MIISKRVLEEIRFRNDIVEVIGSYFHLQRAGSSFKACCPFHKEKTPSFHVNQQRQTYHCFGCGAGGDVFRFMMQKEGVDFMGSARLLAQRAGMSVQFEESSEGASDKAALYRLLSEVAALYHKQLKEHPAAAAARSYLKSRDLPEETWEQFRIGYALDSWDQARNWGRKNDFTDAQMELAGMILKKADADPATSDFYDRFRGRVMFSICDEQGRVIGFSGRCLEADARTAKYVNSPETPLFKKSHVLYLLDKARKNIVDSREAIICEGQIDVIRCHLAGFSRAVAAQGTAFTPDHIRILRRYADSVCILFDADSAGQKAAIRTAALFMEAGLSVRVATLAPGEDPDSFIRKQGAPAFQAALDKAASAVSFQIDVLAAGQPVRGEVSTMRIARAVLQTIRASPNAVQRAALVQEAAARLNLPASALMDDLRHQLRQNQGDPVAEDTDRAGAGKPAAPAPQPAEEVALCEHAIHMMDHPAVRDFVRDYLPLNMLSDPLCRRIVELSLRSMELGEPLQSLLLDEEDPNGFLQRFAAQLFDTPSKTVGREFSPADAVKDIILGLWRKKFEKERTGLSADKPDDLARRQQLTSHIHHLRRWNDGAAIIAIEK
jgi:DNA primase